MRFTSRTAARRKARPAGRTRLRGGIWCRHCVTSSAVPPGGIADIGIRYRCGRHESDQSRLPRIASGRILYRCLSTSALGDDNTDLYLVSLRPRQGHTRFDPAANIAVVAAPVRRRSMIHHPARCARSALRDQTERCVCNVGCMGHRAARRGREALAGPGSPFSPSPAVMQSAGATTRRGGATTQNRTVRL